MHLIEDAPEAVRPTDVIAGAQKSNGQVGANKLMLDRDCASIEEKAQRIAPWGLHHLHPHHAPTPRCRPHKHWVSEGSA